MNTRLLFILSLCVAMLAVWFYRSQDDIEIRTPMSATNIEYEATQIDAVQTNEQGLVSYLLTADQATHYSDTNQDKLAQVNIDWQPNAMRRIHFEAEQGILNQNTGEVRMSQNVVFVSASLAFIASNTPPTSNSSTSVQANTSADTSTAPIQLNAQELIGNLNTNQVRSDMPIAVYQDVSIQGATAQEGNRFESASFQADLNTGEYEFEQVAVVFNPPKRQDVPLF